MNVLPFRWHGRSRVEQIRATLYAAVGDWMQDWSVVRHEIEVDLSQHDRGNTPDAWWCTAGRDAFVQVPPPGLARLGCLLAEVPMGEVQPFAESIGRRALADLLGGWLARPTLELVACEMPDVESLQPRHSGLTLQLTLDSTTLVLHLTQGVCDALVAPQPPQAMALSARRDAVLASTLRLHATLELGSASIDAAATLRPGEIIKATAIVDSIVSVRAEQGGAVLFRGVLESIDGRKALRCTSVELTSGTK